MDKLTKQPNETDLAYHKRLIYGKLVDGTLADEDYSELASFVYGKDYSTDVARRMMYGSRKTLELMENEIERKITSDDILNELDAKRVELQKERQRFFDQRREYNKIVAHDGRREYIEECLISAANRLDTTVGKLFSNDPIDVYDKGDSEAVFVFCDWHYGLETSNIWNTYNTKICRDRIVSVVNQAKKKLMTHNCSTLHVVVLGDLIHGAIHTSARVASEELVCEQIMNASEILAQSISELSSFVNNVFVYVTYGNHARTVQKKDDSIHRDNMERLISWWIRERLRDNQKIEIMPDSDDEFIFLNVCGHGICASHGDLDSVKTSTRLLPTLFQKKYGQNVECVILADKHHRESFEELGVTSMICDALCGSDDYANGKRLYSTPGQLMLIVDPDVGVDAEYRIKC